MKDRFLSYLREHNLVQNSDKILLTISGGVDSMVMADLFIKSGFECSIAHCNFSLRGAESDADEAFVAQFASENHIDFFAVKFDTKSFASENKLSIQEAARNLRYEWFEKVRIENNIQHIATAHHANDSVETFLWNMVRGTGLAGLHGILPRNGNVIRPLLFAFKNEIVEYAVENNILYREDSSNKNTKYSRNLIRKKIIPLLNELKPGAERNIIQTIKYVQESEDLIQAYIDEVSSKFCETTTAGLQINISELQKVKHVKAVLFQVLKKYGFNGDSVSNILKSFDGESGKIFFSETHQLVKDRKFLIISELKKKENEICIIEMNFKNLEFPLPLKFSLIENKPDLVIAFSNKIATLDYDKLKFPLILRKWKHGDYFQPSGMKGKKKMSDFFTDKKFSLNEKDNIWLLCSGEDIIWVVGHRIDERYKLGIETKMIYLVEFLN